MGMEGMMADETDLRKELVALREKVDQIEGFQFGMNAFLIEFVFHLGSLNPEIKGAIGAAFEHAFNDVESFVISKQGLAPNITQALQFLESLRRAAGDNVEKKHVV